MFACGVPEVTCAYDGMVAAGFRRRAPYAGSRGVAAGISGMADRVGRRTSGTMNASDPPSILGHAHPPRSARLRYGPDGTPAPHPADDGAALRLGAPPAPVREWHTETFAEC